MAELLYLCMQYGRPELQMEEGLIVQAKKSLDRMLKISAALGVVKAEWDKEAL